MALERVFRRIRVELLAVVKFDVRPQLDRHRLPVGGGLVAECKLGNRVELLVDVEQLVAERGKDDAADIGARERRIENIGILGEADPQRRLRGGDSAGQDQQRGRSRKTKRLHRTSPLILPAVQLYQHPRRLAYSSRAEKHS